MWHLSQSHLWSALLWPGIEMCSSGFCVISATRPCIWFYCLFTSNGFGLRNPTPKEGFFLVCIGQAQVRSRPRNKWLALVDKPQEWKANLSTVPSLVLDTRLKFGTTKILLTTWARPNNIKLACDQNTRAHDSHMSWHFKDPDSLFSKNVQKLVESSFTHNRIHAAAVPVGCGKRPAAALGSLSYLQKAHLILCWPQGLKSTEAY